MNNISNSHLVAAKIAHEADKILCLQLGLKTNQNYFDDMSEETKNFIISKVKLVANDPEISPEKVHNLWRESKISSGWTKSYKKSYANKTHPDLVPFSELPEKRRIKDTLFISIVKSVFENVGNLLDD